MENYENNRDNIVKGENLIFEYYSHDDNGEVEQVHRAINNLDINVNKGEFVAVLGHNGSGKSTLAKHLNALLMPTKGTLWIKGMKTSNKEKIWDIRQSAGMVFQNPDNQIIATIVEEDVAFGPENLGIEPYNIRKRVKEALNNVGMTSYSKHSPNKLSGGQKQRIAIAGVLAMKPECIILDEPTAMLDPSGREEVMNTIMKLNREDGITIILITHYMEEAIEADRVIVMEEGEIALQGKPKEVFSKVDKMKQLGLDVPQVTEVTYLLRKSGLNIKEDILNIEEMVDAICQLKLEN
jgi:energy-coupling factor transporter ATPase